MNEHAITALREALRVSPDNIPLRQHLADSLMSLSRHADAEQEYRQALALDPANEPLKLGLARAFYLQGKNSPALVIVEDLLKSAHSSAAVHVMHARLLLRAGEIDRAVREYKEALQLDPSARDNELADQLGVGPEEEDRELVDGKLRAVWEEPAESDAGPIERPKVTFKDIGGMDHVKEDIRMKIILPLEQPDLYKAYGKKVGGGILMYGPPGCGKTHLARATAGEVRAGFIAVGINEILEMWIGQSERNLHETFERARNHTPCVLFFDEVDALGASRSDLRHTAGRQLINQFLAELDGMQSDNEGVLILAATNAPWHLDSAFRRPGRFDRILFVPPPDVVGRASILRILLEGKPTRDVDFDQLAKKTVDFSGADLKAVVDVAIDQKLREAVKSGQLKPIVTKDLLGAVGRVRPSTREWFATARNYALYSNQGGIYDDILAYLKL